MMQRSKFCGSINSEKKIKASNEWWLIEINVMKESEKRNQIQINVNGTYDKPAVLICNEYSPFVPLKLFA